MYVCFAGKLSSEKDNTPLASSQNIDVDMIDKLSKNVTFLLEKLVSKTNFSLIAIDKMFQTFKL